MILVHPSTYFIIMFRGFEKKGKVLRLCERGSVTVGNSSFRDCYLYYIYL